mmetsp:Transcript_47882/g.112583  ORF Transcript_47882/g.112583 Transcript_47882/m.112583 type:complete len:209 (-) Transcript_47882:250-876(-)
MVGGPSRGLPRSSRTSRGSPLGSGVGCCRLRGLCRRCRRLQHGSLHHPPLVYLLLWGGACSCHHRYLHQLGAAVGTSPCLCHVRHYGQPPGLCPRPSPLLLRHADDAQLCVGHATHSRMECLLRRVPPRSLGTHAPPSPPTLHPHTHPVLCHPHTHPVLCHPPTHPVLCHPPSTLSTTLPSTLATLLCHPPTTLTTTLSPVTLSTTLP